jgi:hypothetical protein
MMDIDSKGKLSTSLKRLYDLQDNWRSFRWSQDITIPCCQGRFPGQCDFLVSAGVLAQQEGYSTLKFFQFDSSDDMNDGKQWSINNAGFMIRSFAMDVAQDLLVAIELKYV